MLSIALDYRPALLSRAGIGRITRELARALGDREDVRLHLFGHSLAPARVAPPTLPPRTRLHRLPIPGRLLPALARLGLGADRLAGRPAVFHHTDYVQVPARRTPSVLTVHDLAFVRDPSWHGSSAATLRERTERAIRSADRVIVPTHATAADVRAFVPRADVRVVPFGADHVPPDAVGSPREEAPYLLCLGTIEPRKNHLVLLEAMRRLRAPRPRLVVIGSVGWECDEIVAALRQAEREGHVEWLQRADDTEVWHRLRHATALIYPSLWEGFGLPPLEAMRCGVPVIANDVAALREVCAEGAHLVCATDADALADAIGTVLTDRDERRRLREAGSLRASSFRWRDCAARHVEVYRELLR